MVTALQAWGHQRTVLCHIFFPSVKSSSVSSSAVAIGPANQKPRDSMNRAALILFTVSLVLQQLFLLAKSDGILTEHATSDLSSRVHREADRVASVFEWTFCWSQVFCEQQRSQHPENQNETPSRRAVPLDMPTLSPSRNFSSSSWCPKVMHASLGLSLRCYPGPSSPNAQISICLKKAVFTNLASIPALSKIGQTRQTNSYGQHHITPQKPPNPSFPL